MKYFFQYYLPVLISVVLIGIPIYLYLSRPAYGSGNVASNIIVRGGGAVPSNVFGYVRSITIDHTKVGTVNNTDQSYFPVLVSGTYAYLATVGNGGKVQNGSGYDVGFYSDSGCSSKLNWETEQYTASNGQVVYWVQIPTVSHTSDTTFYMCYGNSSISTDQSNASATWNDGGSNFYQSVYHLPNGTSLTANDSTSNARNGSLIGSPTAVVGEMDGAASFNGTSQYIDTSNYSDNQSSFTAEAWVKWTTTPTGIGGTSGGVIVGKLGTGGIASGEGWVIDVTSISGNNNLLTGFIQQNGSNWKQQITTATYNDGNWHQVVLTVSGTTVKLYVDGTIPSETPSSGGTVSTFTNTNNVRIGNDYSSEFLNGSIDEVRVSNTVRSADWIKTEYNSESAPDKANFGSGGFYTVGGQSGALQSGSDVKIRGGGNGGVKFR